MTHKHDSWSQVNLGHEINSLNFEVAQGLNLLFFVWIIGVTRPINTDIGCSWPKKLMKFSYGAIDYHKCYGEFLRDAPKTISFGEIFSERRLNGVPLRVKKPSISLDPICGVLFMGFYENSCFLHKNHLLLKCLIDSRVQWTRKARI